MRLHFYLGKIFGGRFMLLLSGFIAAVIIFESMGGISAQTIFSSAFLGKTALIVHKTMAFIIFLTTLLFFLRLMRFSEIKAMASCGLSLWQILATPLVLTSGVVMLDLWWLSPFAQKTIDPFKKKEGKVALAKPLWHVITHKKSANVPDTIAYSIVHQSSTFMHILNFTPYSRLVHHKQGRLLKNKPPLTLHDAWILTPHHKPLYHPKHSSMMDTGCAIKTSQKHPFLMSFMDVIRALSQTDHHHNIYRFQRDYLLGNSMWMLGVFFLGAALMVGYMSLKKRIVIICLGLMGCFVLYLLKEWVYLALMPFCYGGQPLALWLVPSMTFVISLIILVEKKEL